MNKKNAKIQKLWDRGVQDPRVIAKKLGFSGNALTAGIERVREYLIQEKYIQDEKSPL